MMKLVSQSHGQLFYLILVPYLLKISGLATAPIKIAAIFTERVAVFVYLCCRFRFLLGTTTAPRYQKRLYF